MKPACDPFAETVLDYAYNLVASGALPISDIGGCCDSRNLVRMLLEHDRMPGERPILARVSEGKIDNAVAQALRVLLKRTRRKIRKPSVPRPPTATNLQLIAKTLGFSEVEAAILQFAVAASRQDMRDLLDPISCLGPRRPAILIAAATGLEADEVYSALGCKSQLVTSGLIELNDRGDLDDRVQADRRLEGRGVVHLGGGRRAKLGVCGGRNPKQHRGQQGQHEAGTVQSYGEWMGKHESHRCFDGSLKLL